VSGRRRVGAGLLRSVALLGAAAVCTLLLAAPPLVRADLAVPPQTPSPSTPSPSTPTSSATASPATAESDGGSSSTTAALVTAGVVVVIVAAAAVVGLRRISGRRAGPEGGQPGAGGGPGDEVGS
jgi:hypothetical protein